MLAMVLFFFHYNLVEASLAEKLGIVSDSYTGDPSGVIDLSLDNPYIGGGGGGPSLNPIYNPYEGQSVHELNKYRSMELDNGFRYDSNLGIGVSNHGPSLHYNQPGLGSVGIGSIMDNSGHSLGVTGNAHIGLGPNHNLDIGGFRTNNNMMYGISGSLDLQF